MKLSLRKIGNLLKFFETKIKGAFLIEIEKIEDNRGFFARTWDSEEFKNHNLIHDFVQCSISFNKKKVQFMECIFNYPLTKKLKL